MEKGKRATRLPELGLTMKTLQLRLLAVLSVLSFASPLLSQQISIDTTSARAVLKALHDPDLTHEEAINIARLNGNQGMIRKMRELEEADTEEQFAGALVAAAHGQAASSPQEESYNFSLVKASTPAIESLLDQIERGFVKDLRERIRPFAPKPDSLSLRGYIVAGGDGGGYAFDGPEFYLNIAFNDDILMARQVSVHEAFHGVQGAVYHEDTDHWTRNQTSPADLARGKLCSNFAQLFIDMRNEGTAAYVGTDEVLKDATGPTGKRLYSEFLYDQRHLADSAGLLEISIASLQAPHPVPYKLVYGIDFFGRGIVYSISSAMAGAIAEQDGPGAIGQVIQQPGYDFVLRYSRLKSYGKDSTHPRLGENTVAAAQQLHDGCPASRR
jgi:hypothetical protein